jgi:hypothetical protein
MWKIGKILALMVVGGIVTYYVTGLLVFILLGKPQSADDELNRIFLIWGAALFGFLAPGFMVRSMGYQGAQKIVGTLALMAASGIISLFVLGPYGVAIIAFLVPGVIIWYRHRRGTRKEQSG